MKKILPFLVSIGIALGIGGLSAFLTKDSMPLYASVNQPLLSPPGWVFPVVWSILYVMMGIAAAFVWYENGKTFDGTLFLYGLQLVFNFCWTIIFFNFQAFFFAFIWILILAALVLGTAVLFYRRKKAAGWLMVPYFLWVCFAGYLNYGVYMLNR